MHVGLDLLLSNQSDLLTKQKIGILAHPASINSKGKHIIDLLTAEPKKWNVTALFAPEHGSNSQAIYMEAVESSTHPTLGIPIHSLYGKSEKSLRPTAKMLKDIDCLVIDLQDVGARYYTYIWTMIFCMEACAKYKKKVIVCDRPNPIGGVSVEGDLNQKGFTSFVGWYPIPVRHGMTIGELAHFLNDTQDINCNLTVVPMEGWKRELYFDETGLPWVNPSPNIRNTMQALLYPGMCLIEGTNVSEGRGTETPFEIFGAPFIDPKELTEQLGEFALPGVTFGGCEFRPKEDKFANQNVKGLRLKISDRKTFQPYLTGLAVVWSLCSLYHAKGFQWRMEPYEFIEDTPAIDLLTGSSILREGARKALPLQEIIEWIGSPPESYLRQRTPYLLY